jgi:hypothetical protein
MKRDAKTIMTIPCVGVLLGSLTSREKDPTLPKMRKQI